MLPFKQHVISENELLRVFSCNVDSEDLHWHRDREDREIMVVKSGGWFFQKENELPTPLVNGQVINISKGVYHRVIKGSEDLTLMVIKKNRSERSIRAEKIIGIMDNI